ncbi:Deoxyuridine 5'-triphosphate nucleotidohydrolase [Armadillidium vulgare]|nr:Deoxyuridine 5'-triphosphate nucleotidohydrolase [Armadillidium vulgare]
MEEDAAATPPSAPPPPSPPTLYYQLLNENTYHPYKATAGSAGYDLAVPKAITIPKGCVEKICLDIKVKLPKRCYGRLALRSSSAMQGIDIRGGVIDNDYTGPIYAVLRNENFKKDFRVEKGARLVQLIPERYQPCEIERVKNIESIPHPHDIRTDPINVPSKRIRGTDGFGSSGLKEVLI